MMRLDWPKAFLSAFAVVVAANCLWVPAASSQTATPSTAPPFAPWSHEGWFVQSTDGERCTAISSVVKVATDAEMTFAISYNAKDPYVSLAFSTPETTSLPDEGDVKLKIVFLNNAGDRYDDLWGLREFAYSKDKDKGDYWFFGVFSTKTNSKQILDDIARSSHLGLYTESEKIVFGAPLTGTALVISKLRQCALATAGLNPHDPFIQ